MQARNGNSAPRRNKKRMRKFWRKLGSSSFVIRVLSRFAIAYLSLVHRTNRYVVEPEDALANVTGRQPVIVGVWHGQHVLMPVLPIGLKGTAMVSKNLDGEVTARIIEHFGNRTIRASGGREQKDVLKKGGISGFLEMLETLRQGDNTVQTVDIPKGIARKAGLGIIMLAQRSQRPIVPLAIASSRRFVFERAWDRAALNLPFGTTAICVGNLIEVPENADDDGLEQMRLLLEAEMQNITRRAYQLTGKPE